MLKLPTRAFYLSDRGNCVNEDMAYADAAAGFGFVVDGATGLFPSRFFDSTCGTDAAWFAHRTGALLASELEGGASAADALAVTARRLARELEAAAGAPLAGIEADRIPSATVAVAQVAGDALELAWIGDSPLAVLLAGGEVRLFRDARVSELDAEKISLMVERAQVRAAELGRPLAAAEKRALIDEDEKGQRRTRNAEGGYWIFDPTGAGLAHLKRASLPIEQVRAAAGFSDGLFCAFEQYGLARVEDVLGAPSYGEARALVDRMRVLEASDADLERYPRFKPSDDASMFCLTF